MNHANTRVALLASLSALVASCQSVVATPRNEVQQTAGAASASEALDVRAAMVEGVNPAALACRPRWLLDCLRNECRTGARASAPPG